MLAYTLDLYLNKIPILPILLVFVVLFTIILLQIPDVHADTNAGNSDEGQGPYYTLVGTLTQEGYNEVTTKINFILPLGNLHYSSYGDDYVGNGTITQSTNQGGCAVGQGTAVANLWGHFSPAEGTLFITVQFTDPPSYPSQCNYSFDYVQNGALDVGVLVTIINGHGTGHNSFGISYDVTLTGTQTNSNNPNTQTNTNPCLSNPLTRLSQGNPSWKNDIMGTSVWTIKQKGCAMTSAAMLLSYLSGTSVSPGDLNSWLSNNGGYQGDTANINWQKVADYSTNELGKPLYYRGSVDGEDNTVLNNYLSADDPVILYVGHHFVVATCQAVNPDGTDSYNIADPGHVSRTSLNDPSYQNTYLGLRLFSTTPPGSDASLTITGHSPVELRLTDPSGNVTGIASGTNMTINQIPQSAYYLDYIRDYNDSYTTPEVPTLQVMMPKNGTYKLEVVGTGTGKYSLDFLIYDKSGNSYTEQVNGTATPSSIDVYQLNYSDTQKVSISPTSTNSVPEFPISMFVLFIAIMPIVLLRFRPYFNF